MSDLAQQCEKIRESLKCNDVYCPGDCKAAVSALLAYICELKAELAELRLPVVESARVQQIRKARYNRFSCVANPPHAHMHCHEDGEYCDAAQVLPALADLISAIDASQREKAMVGEALRLVMLQACIESKEDVEFDIKLGHLPEDLRHILLQYAGSKQT